MKKTITFLKRYDQHITQVVSKCTKSLCNIDRVKHNLDSRTLTVIINTLVRAPPYPELRIISQAHDKITRQMNEVDIPIYRVAVGPVTNLIGFRRHST